MNGTWRIFRAECFRLLRSRMVHITAGCLALVAALRVLAERISEQAGAAQRIQKALAAGRPAPEASAATNAWGPFVDGWLAGVTVSTLLLLIFAARTLASDRESGLLRVARTRSATRGALVLGRALLGVPLVLGSLLVTALGAWFAAAALYDFGPIVQDGYELVSTTVLQGEVLKATMVTLAPLFATFCFGLLVSAAGRSGAGAVSAAVAAWLGFDLFKEVLGRAQYWLFAAFTPSLVDKSYLHEVASLARGFSDAGYTNELFAMNVWVPWPEAVLFLAAACWITSRRAL